MSIRAMVLYSAVALLVAPSVSVSVAFGEQPSPGLTSAGLDRMWEALTGTSRGATATDSRFLRRATLDLLGRQPTLDEMATFEADREAGRRGRLIERLLASDEYGQNSANYWSDVIGYRVPQPELTFLNYDSLKSWLAGRFNQNVPFSEIVTGLLTASGKVGENPAAAFIGFHEANEIRLAGETSRIFLGVQLGCAQCHDHPFTDWKREQFHQLAAFFGRADAKLPWNDSDEIVVKSKEKGEYRMPDMHDPTKKGTPMVSTVLTGNAMQPGADDAARRAYLAHWVVAPENPWFAKSFVNRAWARLMSQPLCEAVDCVEAEALYPAIHESLAAYFTSTGYDVKALFRLIMNTKTYQQSTVPGEANEDMLLAKLRGDEVFDSLEAALELPNRTPAAKEPTDDIRFPPPPKSTRDIVDEAFGYDPSLSAAGEPRTMKQAMLMMNNAQVQKRINAAQESGTPLARLLARESDDCIAVTRLFQRVLGRRPTEEEMQASLDHLQSLARTEAFEDLLWSLINTAEFTTRH